jgi:hypothetical protein
MSCPLDRAAAFFRFLAYYTPIRLPEELSAGRERFVARRPAAPRGPTPLVRLRRNIAEIANGGLIVAEIAVFWPGATVRPTKRPRKTSTFSPHSLE